MYLHIFVAKLAREVSCWKRALSEGSAGVEAGSIIQRVVGDNLFRLLKCFFWGVGRYCFLEAKAFPNIMCIRDRLQPLSLSTAPFNIFSKEVSSLATPSKIIPTAPIPTPSSSAVLINERRRPMLCNFEEILRNWRHKADDNLKKCAFSKSPPITDCAAAVRSISFCSPRRARL
ncbi:hypothetical protein T4B_5476 [Trichinella pseudospiralis]|uniref:Uncharacterized protein n=1 Tax=Trichinella pseudospiralis TaxID=6337 RepID=A0A0V1JCX1_TRIPS|nr:hypothetical protein T4B_5476 [Trichinella pseudospiralis]